MGRSKNNVEVRNAAAPLDVLMIGVVGGIRALRLARKVREDWTGMQCLETQAGHHA